jgi:hypothetical protein
MIDKRHESTQVRGSTTYLNKMGRLMNGWMRNWFGMPGRLLALAATGVLVSGLLMSVLHIAVHSDHATQHDQQSLSHCPTCDTIKKTEVVFSPPQLLVRPTFFSELTVEDIVFSLPSLKRYSLKSRSPPHFFG